MTTDEATGKAGKAKRMSKGNYLSDLRGKYFGLGPEVDENPHNQAVVALCDLLLDYTSPRAKGSPLPSVEEQIYNLRRAREDVEYFFMPGQRAPLAKLLSLAGGKMSTLRARVESEHQRALQACVSSSFPLHGGSRADAPAVKATAGALPALGMADEWGAQKSLPPMYQATA